MECSWDQWFDLFLSGQVQRGCWFDHVLSWWNQRHRDNVLFLKYEDLLKDFPTQCQQLADYLGLEFNAEILEDIQQKSSFAHMKQNSFSNMHEVEQLDTFYRKGKIGSWQEHFSDQQTHRMEEKINQKLAPVGLHFTNQGDDVSPA